MARYFLSTFLFICLIGQISMADQGSQLTDEAIKKVAPENMILTEECLNAIKKIPDNFKFGWITVPEDWEAPSESKKISVFYYTSYTDSMTPLIYFNGGPGSNSHGLHQIIEPMSAPRNLGVIYIDQRGTGCSSPIDLKQSPVDLMNLGKNYGTFEIVLDAEQVRKKLLGDRPWKAFGQSFGGLIINRYVSLFPKSLSSVHTYASSTDDSFVDFYMYRMEAQRSILISHELEFKDTLKKIELLKSSLKATDCIQYQEHSICGPILADFMVFSLSGFPSSSKKYIDPLFKPDGSAHLDNMKIEYWSILDYFFSNKFYLTQSILRQETTSQGNLMVLSDDCKKSYAQLEEQFNIQSKAILLSECNILSYVGQNTGAYELFRKVFPSIALRDQLPRTAVYESLKKNPHLKYYAAASGMDPFSNHYSIAEFAKGSPSITFRLYPFFGHGGFKYSQDFWDQMIIKK
jgi:pimeloyl-ACP methyl ester carboxylesterase